MTEENPFTYYSVPEYCDDKKHQVRSIFKHPNYDWIAEDCAKNFFDYHEGWDYTWPITFHLFHELDDEEPFATVKVNQEMKPTFSASVLGKS